MDYELIDSGNKQKFERFGPYHIVRPQATAIWRPTTDWKPDATFTRQERWQGKLPQEWTITLDDLSFRLSPTDFGHLGIFPEHRVIWPWVAKQVSLLNLFAYSGALTLAAARGGAKVCHVDASRGMVDWARQNAEFNSLKNIRWIVDDVMKFVKREVRREKQYNGIVLDPPTFGRGPKGEIFKIEEELPELLDLCFQLKPEFLILSSHTPGYTPQLLQLLLPPGQITSGELLLDTLPSGAYARWER